MKLTKKLATFALALTLVLATLIPASAASGGSIKITGATLADESAYTTYTVYKMLTVEDGNDADENKYKVDSNWIDFVTNPEMASYFSVKETANGSYVLWVKNTTSTADAAAIAELARTYLDDNAAVAAATKVGEVKVNGATLNVTENGYYLLIPNNDTASGVIVVKNGQAKEIVEKSVAPGMPTIEKLVYEDSIQGYSTANTVDVGNAYSYKVTITAGQGASNYILHDKMDEHIKFDETSVAITRGGNTVLPSEYTLVTDNLDDDCTFHIVFNETWCNTLNEGAVIVVTYKGTLIGDEVNGEITEVETDTPHGNTAWLTHTAANVKSDESSVSTKTFEVNVVKHDQDGDALEGAGFVLRDNENNYYKYDEATGTVSWTSNIEDATEYFSDANGKLRFYGVDGEIFTVVEKTVPGGYTGVEDTQANTKTGNIKDGDLVIVNTLGQKLPETGGIGTTAFYVAGALLVLCAMSALLIFKRKTTEE